MPLTQICILASRRQDTKNRRSPTLLPRVPELDTKGVVNYVWQALAQDSPKCFLFKDSSTYQATVLNKEAKLWRIPYPIFLSLFSPPLSQRESRAYNKSSFPLPPLPPARPTHTHRERANPEDDKVVSPSPSFLHDRTKTNLSSKYRTRPFLPFTPPSLSFFFGRSITLTPTQGRGERTHTKREKGLEGRRTNHFA